MNYLASFDFVCLTETWADESFDFNGIFTEHIKFVAPAKRLPQKDNLGNRGRNSGGVLLLIKNCFTKFIKQIQLDCENAVAVIIDKALWGTEKDVMMVACYIPPEHSPVYDGLVLKDGIQILEEAISNTLQGKNCFLFLFGDLNARTADEQPKTENMMNYSPKDEDDDDGDAKVHRQSKDKTINSFGRSLLNTCFMFDCTIVNGTCKDDEEGEFTYVSPHGCSVIDYFILSDELLLQPHLLRVGDRIDSWHMPVELKLQSSGQDKSPVPEEMKGEDRIVWSEDLVQTFKEEIEKDIFKQKIKDAREELQTNADIAVDTFSKALCSAAACMIRTVGKKKDKKQAWFDLECLQQKRLVRRLLQAFQRSKLNSLDKRRAYVEERRKYKNMLQQKKNDYDQARLAQLKMSIKDPKAFWQTVRSINRKSIIYNSITKEQWYDHFFHVFNDVQDQPDTDYPPFDEADEEAEPLFTDAISREEVKASIGNLKAGKSAGPDQIVNEMLKQGSDVVIDFLVDLFNQLFDTGTFPREWSKSVIVPIHKKGDVNKTDNYRGVALTSIVGKVYTHILNKRLTKWTEQNNKIVEEQAGFRAGHSTVDHIFTLFSIVQRFLQKNSKLYVAFVDFRKAFDCVDRTTLWHVLRKAGIHGKLYYAVKGVYNTVLACVRDKNTYTQYFTCPRGVKQGCLLSPLMFSFFVNELAIEVSAYGRHGIQLLPGCIEIFLLLFADDIILLSNTVIGLQNQLNHLKAEADRLHLTVNLDKTNVMVFRGGGHLADREKWHYGDEEVKVTNCYKYLGLTFTTRLSVNSALTEVCRKGRMGVMEILKSLKKLNCIDPGIFWKLFDAQIEPVLTYAAEVWGLEENARQVEKVHTFAIKRFLGVPLHSSNQLVYGETGRYPLYIRIYVKCVKYWLKLMKLPISRICRQTYEMLLIQHNHGKKNWVSGIKQILSENGFGIVWLSQGVGFEQRFVHELKERLIACNMQNWHAELENSDKYLWYHSFKSALEPEKYLSFVTNKWYRECYTRFRLRVCGLQNQRFWFVQNMNSDKLCQVCGKATEDELHFLFYCEAYSAMRQSCSFLIEIKHRPTEHDIVAMLACKDENKIMGLVKFIADAMHTRKQLLELCM